MQRQALVLKEILDFGTRGGMGRSVLQWFDGFEVAKEGIVQGRQGKSRKCSLVCCPIVCRGSLSG